MNTPFFAGAQLLTGAAAQDVNLGPLAALQGTWTSAPAPANTTASGWNVISVPGSQDNQPFVFEVIPYTETLTFQPVVIAGNRGPVVRGTEVQQQITGLMYQQSIISACPGGKPCTDRGFPAGQEIHAETGFLLLLGDPNGGFSLARLSTIPHGNSVLALGNAAQISNPANFIPAVSAIPTDLNGGTHGLGFDYQYAVTEVIQFPEFHQANPNSFLISAIQGQTITQLTELTFSTNRPDATGGILNIPFINTNVTATRMDATFWIETVQGQSALQLQYSQVINLVFPPTGNPAPVVWPHITVNTLIKTA